MGLLQEAAKGILKTELKEIKEQGVTDYNNMVYLNERLAELELALEDVGWLKLVYGESNQFSREALGKIAYLSRLMFLKNPIINRGVKVKQNYVWGQGITVKAKDGEINIVVQEFWNDVKNRQELTSHNAQILKELDLQCDGNVFLVLFTNKANGTVRLRSIPFDQIRDIYTNPDDSKENWYYLREWVDDGGKQKKELYQDWQYTGKAATYKKVGINKNATVMQAKVGGFSDWKFGCSEVYSAIDWAKAYKEFLEDWATITRAYARFAWKATGIKTKAGMDKVKNKFNTTWGVGVADDNPPPLTGSMAVMRGEANLTPMKTAGATTTPESGRRLLLMVAAAFGLPETFFGDASVGTLATAKSLNRPTELAMKSRQTFWKDILMDLMNYALLWSVKAGSLRGKGIVEKNTYGTEDVKWKEYGYQDVVEITFPDVIEPDKLRNVEAITKAVTLDRGISSGMIDDEHILKMLLIALGEQDVEQVIDQMDDQFKQALEVFTEKYFRKEQ